MSDFSGIKALTFDVFGTTVDWCGGIARESRAMLGPRGHSLDWVAFANRWRRDFLPAMDEVRSGRRGYVTMDQLHREMLDPVVAEFGVDLSDAEKDQFALSWRRLDPWPDVVPAMTRLKKHFILAALSNGNTALVVNMAKRSGLPWDVVLGADFVRTYKPMPVLYYSAPLLRDLKPSEIMMVACHMWDLDAAAKQGLRTAYVRRKDEYGVGAPIQTPAKGAYDLQLESFEELADALEH